MRHLTRTVIQRRGYRVFEARSGVEGLSIWAEHAPEISLVLTDMVMPGGISGRQLGDQLRMEKSDLKVVYTSGHCPDGLSQGLKLNEGINFLAKPYRSDKLLDIIRRALDEISG